MSSLKLNASKTLGGIIIPFLIVAGLAGGYFLLLPKYKAVKTGEEAFAAKEAKVTSRETQLTNLQDLVAEMRKKKEALSSLDEAIPDAPRIPELLANLDYLASQSGLFLSTINLTTESSLSTVTTEREVKTDQEKKSGMPDLKIMKVSIDLKGEYKSLKTFLLNLEQNLRLADVEAILISPPGEKSNIQEYTLSFKTYYQNGESR